MAARQPPVTPMIRQAAKVTFCVRGVVSPLLANIYLHELDVEMREAGLVMVRYADDAVVLCRSREEAEAALA
ncbi:MAG TPA: reverse transcriptase domain-containing protein, partial [Gemmatimonadaceae bacterium]|nr:reverse transcriptase domain-containing protein [Gemmatimonadaceae bacterium]